MSMSAVFVDERRAKCNHRSDVRVYDRCTSSAAWPQKRSIASRPVERGGRGGEAERNFRAPSSHGGPEFSAVLTHGRQLGFEIQTAVGPYPRINSYLFPCYQYYWS